MRKKPSKYEREQEKKRQVRKAFTRRMRKLERAVDALSVELLNARDRGEFNVHNRLYQEVAGARRALYAALQYAPSY